VKIYYQNNRILNNERFIMSKKNYRVTDTYLIECTNQKLIFTLIFSENTTKLNSKTKNILLMPKISTNIP